MTVAAHSRLLALAAATAMLFHAGSALAAADGEKLFKRCSACHSLEAGKKKVGPSLAGIVGRKAGSEAFKYSSLTEAAGAAGLVWTEENLAAYLADPTQFLTEWLKENGKEASGRSRMTFKMPKEDQREAVAAYLASLGK